MACPPVGANDAGQGPPAQSPRSGRRSTAHSVEVVSVEQHSAVSFLRTTFPTPQVRPPGSVFLRKLGAAVAVRKCTATFSLRFRQIDPSLSRHIPRLVALAKATAAQDLSSAHHARVVSQYAFQPYVDAPAILGDTVAAAHLSNCVRMMLQLGSSSRCTHLNGVIS